MIDGIDDSRNETIGVCEFCIEEGSSTQVERYGGKNTVENGGRWLMGKRRVIILFALIRGQLVSFSPPFSWTCVKIDGVCQLTEELRSFREMLS